MEEKLPQPYSCPECQAGMMRPQRITYLTWLDDEMITVPDFPAWVCDVCGRREYDEYAMSWLSMLLNPNTGRAISDPHRGRPAANNQDHVPPVTK
jgi:YgiT-type zinc finger domain-containing protein